MNKRPIAYDRDNPNSNGYFAAVLADLAYKSQAEIERELVEYGYPDTKVWFFRTTLAAGFILEWDDVIAVSFKGSSTWREWLNNANVWLKRTPYGRIHAGFYNTIQQVGPVIYRAILPGLLSGSKVVVTGHSRGGALALLFVGMLALNGFSAHSAFTFGAPKIGDQEFANNWTSDPQPVRLRWCPSWVLFPVTIISTLLFLVWALVVAPLPRLVAHRLRLGRGNKTV